MASKVDRVEKEFILAAAAESGLSLRLQAAGRTLRARLEACDRGLLRLAPPQDGEPAFRTGEFLSAFLEFRGQGLSFGSEVRASGPGRLELHWPAHMYRSLSRRWPRVREPRGLSAELLIPGAALRLPYPECREYSELAQPCIQAPRGIPSIAGLVEDFRRGAAELASLGRVIMFREGRLPAGPAEEMAVRLGRVLFFPSTLSGLPIADPYPERRILTRAEAEDFEGPTALGGNSPLEAFIALGRARGLNAALWCPILYYRYALGLVYLENGADRPRSLDFGAVDFAWDFARALAWSLERNAYFPGIEAGEEGRPAEILDASPSGLLVDLSADHPPLRPGSSLGLRLALEGEGLECSALVARRVEGGRGLRYGLALGGLDERGLELLSRGLYGSTESLESALGA